MFLTEQSSQSKKCTQTNQMFGTNHLPTYGLIHEELLGGTSVIPANLTLTQVLAALWHHGNINISQVKFNLVFTKDVSQGNLFYIVPLSCCLFFVYNTENKF